VSDPQKWGPPYWDDEHAGYAHDLLFFEGLDLTHLMLADTTRFNSGIVELKYVPK